MPIHPEPVAFLYPPRPHARRHGPHGYADLDSFRPWLRDEFSFRCVYCLTREKWGRITGEFDLDHFVAQHLDLQQTLDYDNLLYSCHACNLRKGKQSIPDPAAALTSASVRVYPDGTLVGSNPAAEKIIRLLCLNSPAWTRWRRTWIRVIELAEEFDPALHRELMGYPDDLPDLSRRRPPVNTRPEGVSKSHFAQHRRNELADTYLW